MRIRWRGLELPSRVIADIETATSTYGLFAAEPFEGGFGATIGTGYDQGRLCICQSRAMLSTAASSPGCLAPRKLA